MRGEILGLLGGWTGRAGRVSCLLLALQGGIGWAVAQSTDGEPSSRGRARSSSSLRITTETLFGGVPSGAATDEVLPLSQLEAVQRGLQQNLAVVLGRELVRQAEGQRDERRSELLPHLRGVATQRRQEFNLAATAFQDLPGIEVGVVGPFDVFDARLYLSLPLFDRSARQDLAAAKAGLEAERFSYQGWRELIMLAVSNLYLRSLAAGIRVEVAEAQVETAESLFELAKDRNASGLVPGIEVLRADVQLQDDRQRLIAARSEHAKAELRLARAIGLPLGQPFRLTGELRYVPPPEIPRAEALAYAYRHRADVAAAEARLREAAALRRAATGHRWPELGLKGDYGASGAAADTAEGTFGVAAELRIPLYEGGRIGARTEETDAHLRQRGAQLEDLRANVFYQLENAFLDLEAADQGVRVAERASGLAERQLLQARNRFAAGVADNLEVVQAQEAVARARNDEVQRLLEHRLAKGRLAVALGLGERHLMGYLMGEAFAGLPEEEP